MKSILGLTFCGLLGAGSLLGLVGCRDEVVCDCNAGCSCGDSGFTCVLSGSAGGCALLDTSCAGSGMRFDVSAPGALSGMCVEPEGADLSMSPPADLAADASVPVDLSGADLTGVVVDMVLPPDLSHPPDLRQPVDMATLCGHGGEACCGGPFAPCNAGLTCASNKCVSNDIFVIGDYFDVSSFSNIPYTIHYDGTNWSPGPTIVNAAGNTYLYGIWGDAPGNWWMAGDSGSVYLLSGTLWLNCGNPNSCAKSNTTNQLQSVYGFNSSSDFWIGGGGSVGTMLQCTSAACVSKASGLPSTGFGVGQMSGTSSSDLWASLYTSIAHYDGTTWTVNSTFKSRAVWAHSKSDVWTGDTQIFHYNGSAWSPPYAINGMSMVVGNIFGMSGTATNDVWAVGYDGSNGAHPTFAAHWDGTSWTNKTLPAGFAAGRAVFAVSKTEAYLVGDTGVLKWNGSAWSTVTLPSSIQTASWQNVYGSARPR